MQFGISDFGHWSLFDIWCLLFGIYEFATCALRLFTPLLLHQPQKWHLNNVLFFKQIHNSLKINIIGHTGIIGAEVHQQLPIKDFVAHHTHQTGSQIKAGQKIGQLLTTGGFNGSDLTLTQNLWTHNPEPLNPGRLPISSFLAALRPAPPRPVPLRRLLQHRLR
jgi:hypothetical protein